MRLFPILLLNVMTLLFAAGLRADLSWREEDSLRLIQDMRRAYAQVDDYQTLLVIQGFGSESRFQSEHRLRYTFKKPHHIRIDFIYPHEGMVILYPGKKGKVTVRPAFLGSLFTVNLSPYNSLLEVSPGQQQENGGREDLLNPCHGVEVTSCLQSGKGISINLLEGIRFCLLSGCQAPAV